MKTIKSVNYHLWEPCNMGCKFCFAKFQDVKSSILPKGHLSKTESFEIIDKLIESGFEKISFAGGEPTLCKWLPELIRKSKMGGMTTMLITNGTMLTEGYIKKIKDHIDWIVLSIDSLNQNTNIETGRTVKGVPLSSIKYIELINLIKKYNIRFKMNTVVTSKNYKEDFNEFIKQVLPERWKILQVLPINGQNENEIKEFKLSKRQFTQFCSSHKSLGDIGTRLVIENNDMMLGSYIMIDPAGRFFDNTKSQHTYSEEILKVGIAKALSQMNYSTSKFIKRGGKYKW